MRKFLLALFKVIIFCALLLAITLFSSVATFRYIFATSQVTIPDIIGQTTEYAADLLTEQRLRLVVVEEQLDSKLPEGHILAQDPLAGAKTPKNQVVRVVISKGLETFPVPDVTGKTLAEAKRLLRQQQFRVGSVTYAHTNEMPADKIFAQTPQANQDGKIGERVHLMISQGAYKSVMVMPDLVEQQFAYAAQVVEQLGLVVGNIAYEEYESVPPDTVLSHVPKPGALVDEQNMVTFVLSGKPRKSANAKAAETFSLQYQPLEYTIPPGPFEVEVLAVVKNADGEAEIYRQLVMPGHRVILQIPVIGNTVVELYVDGALEVVQRFQ